MKRFILYISLMRPIIRLLNYSLKEIDFQYYSLTKTERLLVSEKQLVKIKKICN